MNPQRSSWNTLLIQVPGLINQRGRDRDIILISNQPQITIKKTNKQTKKGVIISGRGSAKQWSPTMKGKNLSLKQFEDCRGQC